MVNKFCDQTYDNWEIMQLLFCQYDPIGRIVRLH